jgi:hypothetical protein
VLSFFGRQFAEPQVLLIFRILVPACVVGAVATYVATLLLTEGSAGVSACVLALQTSVGFVVYPLTIGQWGVVGAAATNAGLAALGAAAFAVLYGRLFGPIRPSPSPAPRDLTDPILTEV